MIDHNSATPMYIQIVQTISDAIQSGEYKVGEKLPSENELCKKYQVSRITVRQALTALSQQDLVISVHGKGTFVKAPTINNDLHRIVSFSELLKARGLTGFTRVHSFEDSVESEKAAEILGGSLSRLTLIGYISNRPAVYYYSFFTPELGNRMLEGALKAEKLNGAFSTYDLYAQSGVSPVRVEQTISAVNADASLEHILNVPPKTALIVLESVYYDAEDKPLEYKVAYYRSDMYSFKLRREF